MHIDRTRTPEAKARTVQLSRARMVKAAAPNALRYAERRALPGSGAFLALAFGLEG
jgi:hypothetical protein